MTSRLSRRAIRVLASIGYAGSNLSNSDDPTAIELWLAQGRQLGSWAAIPYVVVNFLYIH